MIESGDFDVFLYEMAPDRALNVAQTVWTRVLRVCFPVFNQIIGKVRETQPQVVLSGEDCASRSPRGVAARGVVLPPPDLKSCPHL